MAPIVGNVCMDMIMVNVSDIDCDEGDEVIIFGAHPSAMDFAKTANTISYEIITAISQRIKRVIIK
jgi:alanine racemase